jgi:hypothetical protein
MIMCGDSPEERLEKMLVNWGTVVAHRRHGGTDWPRGQGSARGRVSGSSGLKDDYLSIERAIAEIPDPVDREAVRARLASEYVAYAEGKRWSFGGWLSREAEGATRLDRRAMREEMSKASGMVRAWRKKLEEAWFGSRTNKRRMLPKGCS